MKQLLARSGKVVVVEVPDPVCPPNSVMVRNEFSVISTGTESWTIESTDPVSTGDIVRDSSLAKKALRNTTEVLRTEGLWGLVDYVDAVRHPEVPLGYSCAGTVVSVGRLVRDVTPGERVACAGEGKAAHAGARLRPQKSPGQGPGRCVNEGRCLLHHRRDSLARCEDRGSTIR